MKRTICAVLVILLFLTTVMPAQAASSQPSAWAVERVAQARDRGLVPEALLSNYQAPITRQEFAMLVAKAYTGLSGKTVVPSSSDTFTDTRDRDVLIAYSLKIVTGIGGGLFAPQRNITRQEICVMLTRMVKALNADADTSPPSGLMFMDDENIGSWAMDNVKYLFSRGIIGGVGGQRIDPLNSATREQAFLLVLNLADRYPKFELHDEAIAAFYLPTNGEIYIKVNSIAGRSDRLIVNYDLIEKAYFTSAEFASLKAGKPVKKYGETFTYGSYHDNNSYYSAGKWVEVDKMVNVIYSDSDGIYSWSIEGDKVRLLDYFIDPTVFKTVQEGLKGTVPKEAKIRLLRYADDGWRTDYITDFSTMLREETLANYRRFAVTIKNGQWTELEQMYQS